MEININQLKKHIKNNKLEICTSEFNQLEKYVHLFFEWNQRINLSAHTEEEDLYLKDLIDTIYCVRYIDSQLTGTHDIADFGCGAGFFGLIYKILNPCTKRNTFLFDKSRKKINFVKQTIRTINLTHIDAIQANIDRNTNSLGKKFDLIVSRATWNLEDFLQYARPYLNNTGIVIYMGGRKEFDLTSLDIIDQQKSSSFDYEILPNGYKRTIYQMILKS